MKKDWSYFYYVFNIKIYFAASIRGGRENQGVHEKLIKELQKIGEVLTEHIGSEELTGYGETTRSNEDIFLRDMEWVRESDVIVAEVSTPSLGVGYELGQGESLGKKVICLYQVQDGKRLSAMISGNNYFNVCEYKTIEEAISFVKKYLS